MCAVSTAAAAKALMPVMSAATNLLHQGLRFE